MSATIPERRDNESAKAYAAFVEYATLGEGRSCEKVAAKYQKSVSLLYRWYATHDWQARTRAYDDALAELAADAHRESYLKDLEEHRKRYKKVGMQLCAVAQGLLGQLARSVQGKTIKGEDGNEYVIPTIKLSSDSLSTVARALTVAADLEAHALNLDKLLPSLTNDHE